MFLSTNHHTNTLPVAEPTEIALLHEGAIRTNRFWGRAEPSYVLESRAWLHPVERFVVDVSCKGRDESRVILSNCYRHYVKYDTDWNPDKGVESNEKDGTNGAV